MKNKTKVYLLSKSTNKLMHRPFYPNKNVLCVDNIEEADFILAPSTCKNNSISYSQMINHPLFKKYENKFAIYVNDDDPGFLYDDKKCIKWVSQPSRNKEENAKHNITTIPLIMSDHYHIDDNTIARLRENKKIYDFCFIGSVGCYNRSILKNIEHPKYYFEDTSNFTIYTDMSKQDKIDHIIAFLEKISKSKFVFCPRGIGSSSFRLYEAMMVGSVPIITGMNDYPFDDIVKWDDFSIRTTLDSQGLKFAAKQTKEINYNLMRENGINFWEKYCKMENMYKCLTK